MEGNRPMTQNMLAASSLESSVAEKDLGVFVDTKLSRSYAPLQQRQPTASWASLGRALLSG